MVGCWNDTDTYCYECISTKSHEIYCDYTQPEIDNVINYYKELGDTLNCIKQ